MKCYYTGFWLPLLPLRIWLSVCHSLEGTVFSLILFFFFSLTLEVLLCLVPHNFIIHTPQWISFDFPFWEPLVFISVGIGVFHQLWETLRYYRFKDLSALFFHSFSPYGSPLRIRYTFLFYSPYLKPCFIPSIALVFFCIVDNIFKSHFLKTLKKNF